jgi:nucleoid DNA-binding protein
MPTKKDIVRRIADKHQLTQVDTHNVVQSTLDAIADVLADEGRLELRDFGIFQVKQRASRKARNPKTGDPVIVPPRKVVTFKPGKALEERVRSSRQAPES